MTTHSWIGGPPFVCIQCAKRLPYNQITELDATEECPTPLATSDEGPAPPSDVGVVL